MCRVVVELINSQVHSRSLEEVLDDVIESQLLIRHYLTRRYASIQFITYVESFNVNLSQCAVRSHLFYDLHLHVCYALSNG